MLYSHKLMLESLFFFILFLLPMTKAASDELPPQVNQLQARVMEVDEKIAMIESDHQKMNGTISALQTSLNTVNQEISGLKTRHNLMAKTLAETQRTANGHGRGGQ